MWSGEEGSRDVGSVTLAAAALLASTVLLAVVVADIAMVLRVRTSVANAADAGALAAAPLTFRPGSSTPEAEAATFVVANGAALLDCDCAIDMTWRRRTVTVVAGATVDTSVAGRISLVVSSRAEFVPIAAFTGEA